MNQLLHGNDLDRGRPRVMARPLDENWSATLNGRVIGQAASLAKGAAFLDHVRRGPASLLIAGEAGTGKSTLWTTILTEARARRYAIVRARPAEAEASLAFAGLSDLLATALPGVEGRLPKPQARALRVAVLLEDPNGPAPDQRAVSIATLNLIRALAADTPTLVAVDDVQWLDAATTRVLEFAGRRLVDERVGLLVVERTGASENRQAGATLLGWPAEPIVTMPAPLRPGELGELFRSRLGTGFSRTLLTQIALTSGGNPLFALELARAIERGETRVQPGEPLPLPRTLEQVVHGRLTGLAPEMQDLLFAAAAASDPTPDLLARALPGGAPATLLEGAIGAGLLEESDGQLRFSHPLYASTIYHSVPVERRRSIHRRLADVVDGSYERAHHLSLAATAPDPVVALALEEAAHVAASHGATDAAAGLIEQAISSTPPTDSKVESRRLEAAAYHFAAGSTGRARDLLEGLAAWAPPGVFRADVLRRLATVRYRHDSCSAAAELLTRALPEAGDDVDLLARLHRDLAWAITQCGDVRGAAAHARAGLDLAERHGATEMLPELLAANAVGEFLLGEGMPAAVIERAVQLERPGSDVPIEWQPRMMLALMLKWAGELPAALSHLADLHRREAEVGGETSLPFLLAQISEANTWAGAWGAALGAAQEAYSTASQTEQEPMQAIALYARSLVRAHLGDVEGARADARQGLEHSERVGSVVSMMLNQSVLGHIELSLGQPARAHEWLGPLVTWLDVVGIREPGVLRFVPDEVEALVGIGHLARADALLTPYEQDAVRLGRPWARLAAARGRALHTAAVGRVAQADEPLRAALEELGQLVPPFERARCLLVLGGVLRRTRKRAAARTALESALALFDQLGAGVWADRTRELLGGKRAARTSGRALLTPAEERVATLVSAGATNREVADRLFISIRAVETHLTSVYRKLEVTSRTALAARFATDDRHARPTLRQSPTATTTARSSALPTTSGRADSRRRP